MPDKEEAKSNEPMVDLDTSGPGARVELPEVEKEADKTYEKEVKKMKQMLRTMMSPITHLRNGDEQPGVRDEKDEGNLRLQES